MANSYFAVLGLDERFDIDLKELERKYLELQLRYHPDNGGSVAHSAELNVSYKVLANDMARAEHLLAVNDVALPKLSNEYMMEVMDAYEDGAAQDSAIVLLKADMARHFAAGDFIAASEALVKIKALRRASGGALAS
jgi:DnaJ-domain-containing protein 1